MASTRCFTSGFLKSFFSMTLFVIWSRIIYKNEKKKPQVYCFVRSATESDQSEAWDDITPMFKNTRKRFPNFSLWTHFRKIRNLYDPLNIHNSIITLNKHWRRVVEKSFWAPQFGNLCCRLASLPFNLSGTTYSLLKVRDFETWTLGAFWVFPIAEYKI